ncbi:MAG: GTP-binding protein TypA [Candidatus Gottesmanbacteria bacterium GW2011_GWA2_41_12]|uniref:50S ribosomal subunit assembly factor BipA n=2 Tax=Candidatus Gottesmaniibacteriota TaxID=1752720 RepID=A0A0G0UII2_9BACT|nr:MAG: GTP-binding protein TypA [Candidatus Gottesmanbacteria bacterium GW2011_GWC2_39_8]KKR88588.1 MAG: GTP-binding protein TypA [Candidatus Gottesmanbacteria bacterium GW2011_GWA2_41_12]
MNLRNIAIIAHVDHGKTTLVDALLKQTHTFRENEAEMTQTLIMDSNELEREKGITILAKNTAVSYKNTKINIIDTPGHADFSGEVERVINMADGALLIVDSAEGPLPQTKFVLKKSLEAGLKIILVVNKIDKKDARPEEVLRETEELFLHLADDPSHLEFPVIYAAGRQGKAYNNLPSSLDDNATLEPLFEKIVSYIPAPTVEKDKPFKMLVSSLDFDTYNGKYALGKIRSGTLKTGQSLLVLDDKGNKTSGKIEKLFVNQGIKRVEITEAEAGDIVWLTGFPDIAIGQTLSDPSDLTPLPTIKITEPTIKIVVGPNTSPLAGKEGKFFTARQIRDRLIKEKETNIGLIIEENPGGNGFIISGRGELHLAVLIETLRREGFELEAGKPQVIYKDVGGKIHEPYEEVTIELPKEFVGIATSEMGKRKGELLDMHGDDRGTRMVYKISSQHLLGLRNSLLSQTKGQGLFTTILLGYFPKSEEIAKVRNGVLLASQPGKSLSYGMDSAQKHGALFISPGESVYEGMIVGENNRSEDIELNVCKGKKLTNMHTENSDEAIILTPAKKMSLEQCLDFLEDEELLEVTPLNLRLRKKYLMHSDRVRQDRKNQGKQLNSIA